MSHVEFAHLLSSIHHLSPAQMRQLFRELETQLMAAEAHAAGPGPGSLGAMRDAAAELDEAVEHAMQLRQRPWRQPDGE